MNANTNPAHIIRLAGPWQRIVLSSDQELAATEEQTVRMPVDIATDLGATFSGRVEYRRHFHRPTGIDASTKLILALDHVLGRRLEVFLNGELLGQYEKACGRFSFDIYYRLKPRNSLSVRVSTWHDENKLQGDSPDTPCGLVGEVRLEIS